VNFHLHSEKKAPEDASKKYRVQRSNNEKEYPLSVVEPEKNFFETLAAV
jgi:hypothetical protein